MSRSFIFGKKYTIPGRPLFMFIPAYECKIKEIVPCTEDALTTPNLVNQVAEVMLL